MEKEMEIKMSIQDALDTLNPMQREAAVHTEGPLLILAGAVPENKSADSQDCLFNGGKGRQSLEYPGDHLYQQGCQ